MALRAEVLGFRVVEREVGMVGGVLRDGGGWVWSLGGRTVMLLRRDIEYHC